MVAEIFNSFVCACCGYPCPHSDMVIGLIDNTTPKILLLLLSSETKSIKHLSRIHLSTISKDYVIHNSYIGKLAFAISNAFHKSLSKNEPQLP